jgi:NADH-quinone oxidoreductase subunit G
VTTNGERPTPSVNVTIDGREVEAPAGELLIKVAQDHGVYIPRFCWHERMEPVGMCRMCLVEVDGVRGLPPACTTRVTDGMVCRTGTDAVKKVQDGVLEFLLVNHPLDCPVCDRGGECPLQDQTLAFGPGETRFVEEKRHWEKPIPLSDLVLLDRERCIQCARCTRFADEIAGDPLITFFDRGDRTQVLNFLEQPFDSYYSGNTVQICPVGALTAKPYRFRARPWDLATTETTCTLCSVGCRGALQSSSNRLVRFLGVDSPAVNHGWLCDKGRYGFEYVHSEDRVREPHLRRGGELRPVSWPEALEAAAAELRKVVDLHGPSSIAVLGGARGSNEDAYVWSRLAKATLRTDNVDCQLGDGLPPEAVLGLPRAEIDDCDRARAIVLLAPDVREEVPVLFLRLRRAAKELGIPFVDIAATDHGLSPYAAARLRPAPGEQAVTARRLADAVASAAPSGDDAIDAAAALLRASAGASGPVGPVVVVLGRPSLAEAPDFTTSAASALLEIPGAVFLSALRRGNVHGALDLGLAPGLLPGRVTLDAGAGWFSQRWGGVPESRGLDAAGILTAAAEGRIRVLVLVGADPLADFPDRVLARRALDAVDTVIAVDGFLSQSTRRADVFLPATLWGEKSGSTTNLEGRVTRLGRRVSPEGTTMDEWRIASELAFRLGDDYDYADIDDVTDEIARVSPAHHGLDSELLRRALDGVVVPAADHLGEVVLRTGALSILAEDGDGVSWDPIRAAGETAVEAAEHDEDAAQLIETAGADPEPGAPALIEFQPPGADPATPPRDAYSLRAVVGRTLYDAGRAVAGSPSIAGLAPALVLRVSPTDIHRLGTDDGDEVKVTSARGSARFRIVADGGVPQGIARVAFTADGGGVSELLDATLPVTDLRVETLS